MRQQVQYLLALLAFSSANAQSLPMYISAGPSQYVSTSGVTWVADTPFVSGGRVYSDTRPDVAGTDDDGLYHVERYFRHFEDALYSIPLPSTSTHVEVTLLFAENFFRDVGKRSFDITMEGTTVATAFDIVEQAGGSKVAVEFVQTVTVTDGVLDIMLPRRVQNPKINGIKIVSVGSGSAAPASAAPVSASPVSAAPVTAAPVSAAPVSAYQVTDAPVSVAPVSSAPMTVAPVTAAPTFAPVATPSATPLIILNLIHAPSNAVLSEVTDGTVIDMKDYGVSAEFNIEAVEQDSNIVRVNFIESNKSEGVRPFAFCGDNSGDFKVCPTLSFGMNTVTVEGVDASGNIIGQVQATFEVVDTRPSTPSPTPAPAPLAPASFPRWIETDANATIDERHEACFVMVNNPVVGRKAYLVGGRGNKALDILDPVTRTWSTGLEPPIQMHHMQCVAAQGLLWVVSPWTDWYPQESNVDLIYVYDPATNTWSTKPGLPPSRQRGGAAVIVSDDEMKLYVSHGNNGGHEIAGSNHAESLGYLDEFDIATETWTALSSNAPNPRDHTGGAMVNGRICVAGGRNGGIANWPEVAPTDCYDLSTGTWSVEAPIPQVRGGSAYGQTCDGKLMIAGGEGSGQAWDNVDVFDGTSWTTIEALNIGRHGTGLAFDCVCDQIIIASGATSQGGGPETTSVETYVPAGVDPFCLA